MHVTPILAGPLLMVLAVLAAPAGPAAAESPGETIGQLQAQGYTVNIDRVGSAPLDDCIVVGVRNPQTVTKWIRVERNNSHRRDDDEHGDRRGDRDYDLVEVVVSKSISVSLDCTR